MSELSPEETVDACEFLLSSDAAKDGIGFMFAQAIRALLYHYKGLERDYAIQYAELTAAINKPEPGSNN